jgi:hypothetical protein
MPAVRSVPSRSEKALIAVIQEAWIGSADPRNGQVPRAWPAPGRCVGPGSTGSRHSPSAASGSTNSCSPASIGVRARAGSSSMTVGRRNRRPRGESALPHEQCRPRLRQRHAILVEPRSNLPHKPAHGSVNVLRLLFAVSQLDVHGRVSPCVPNSIKRSVGLIKELPIIRQGPSRRVRRVASCHIGLDRPED